MTANTDRKEPQHIAILRELRDQDYAQDESTGMRFTLERAALDAAIAALATPPPCGGEAVTAAMLADAFGCFWNAAIGSDSVRDDSTAASTVSGMAMGFAAIETRLREYAALASTPAQADPTDSATPDRDQCGHGTPADPTAIDAYLAAQAVGAQGEAVAWIGADNLNRLRGGWSATVYGAAAKVHADAGTRASIPANLVPLYAAPAGQAVTDAERAFDAGYTVAASWACRDDLLADMTSPAYARDRAIALTPPAGEGDGK